MLPRNARAAARNKLRKLAETQQNKFKRAQVAVAVQMHEKANSNKKMRDVIKAAVSAYTKTSNYTLLLPRLYAFTGKYGIKAPMRIFRYIMVLQQGVQNANNSLSFNINVLSKLIRNGPFIESLIKKYPGAVTVDFMKELITDAIGASHAIPKSDVTTYISMLINQLDLIAEQYFKNERAAVPTISSQVNQVNILTGMNVLMKHALSNNSNKQARFRTTYIKTVRERVAGRPCIDNLLEELTSTVFGETFEWKGKSLNKIYNTTNDYHKLMFNTLPSLTNTTLKNNKNFINGTASVQANKIWNLLKNQQIHVRNSQGIPVYMLIRNHDRNGESFKKAYRKMMGNNN
jgi:hypothetical protein